MIFMWMANDWLPPASFPDRGKIACARPSRDATRLVDATMDLRLLPDANGVIDLTTLDDDSPIDLIAAGLGNLSVNSPSLGPSSSGQGNSRNHDETKTKILRGRPIVASRLTSTNHRPFMSWSENQYPPPPPYKYADNIPKPKVIYIKREEHANEMIDSLNGFSRSNNLPSAVGLDLEWPFSRDKAGNEKEGKVALVQLCDVDIILLIHISKMERFPRKVKELIESSKVPKMGANIRNDGRKLFCDYGIVSSNLIELGALAGEIDKNFASSVKRPIVSLANMVSRCLKKTLEKGPVRTSDWSKDLTPEQMIYAANDVHSGLMVYKSLMRTAQSSKTRLVPERYTADLAKELRRPDDGSVSQISATLVHPRDGEAPHRCAYTLWRQGHGLLGICIKMGDRAHPQRDSVVISYILRALTEDPALPFSMTALTSLIKLDSSSWVHNRDLIERWTQEGRGVDENCAKG